MALEPTLTAFKLCEMLFGQTFAEAPLKKSVSPRRLAQEEVDNSLSLMKLYFDILGRESANNFLISSSVLRGRHKHTTIK